MDKEGALYELRNAVGQFKYSKRDGNPVVSQISAGMIQLCDALTHAVDNSRRSHAARMFGEAAKTMQAAAHVASKAPNTDISLMSFAWGCVHLCNTIRDVAASD